MTKKSPRITQTDAKKFRKRKFALIGAWHAGAVGLRWLYARLIGAGGSIGRKFAFPLFVSIRVKEPCEKEASANPQPTWLPLQFNRTIQRLPLRTAASTVAE
jgi:hypothetical protein